MRRALLLVLLAATACASGQGWAAFGTPAALHTRGRDHRFHLERRPADPPPPAHVALPAIDVVRASAPLGGFFAFDNLELGDATLVAFRREHRGLELALVRGGAIEATTAIAGDEVHSARLVLHGPDVAVVYSLDEAIVFASWSQAEHKLRVAPRTLVAHLPHCFMKPVVTALVSDGSLLWAAFMAHAWGRHGDLCTGFTRRDVEVSATVAISAEGDTSQLLIHPHRDQPADLAVHQGGRVFGRQDPDIGFVVVREH